MKNRIMFLVIMFILSCNMISYASESEGDSYKGLVIGENGERAEIEGVLISERQLPATRSAEYNRYERTYMYAVPRGVTGSVTVDETDDALVTTAYLTIKKRSDGKRCYNRDRGRLPTRRKSIPTLSKCVSE